MKTVLILGAYGLLGRYVCEQLETEGHRVIRQSRSGHAGALVFDPCVPGVLTERLSSLAVDAIVNAAAVTNVDYCQTHLNEAYRLNTGVPEAISAWVERRSAECHVIQISTDQMYARPGHQAEADVDLLNAYALTKYAGEIALRALPNHTILRTNFFGRSRTPGRESFSDWIFGALTRNTPIRLAVDIEFNPLSLATLARYIAAVVRGPARGVFNVGSRGAESKHGFGMRFARELSIAPACITACTAEELGFRVPRPLDMRMDVGRFEAIHGPMPELDDEIVRSARTYLESKQ